MKFLHLALVVSLLFTFACSKDDESSTSEEAFLKPASEEFIRENLPGSWKLKSMKMEGYRKLSGQYVSYYFEDGINYSGGITFHSDSIIYSDLTYTYRYSIKDENGETTLTEFRDYNLTPLNGYCKIYSTNWLRTDAFGMDRNFEISRMTERKMELKRVKSNSDPSIKTTEILTYSYIFEKE